MGWGILGRRSGDFYTVTDNNYTGTAQRGNSRGSASYAFPHNEDSAEHLIGALLAGVAEAWQECVYRVMQEFREWLATRTETSGTGAALSIASQIMISTENGITALSGLNFCENAKPDVKER